MFPLTNSILMPDEMKVTSCNWEKPENKTWKTLPTIPIMVTL